MRKKQFIEMLGSVWLFSRCTKKELDAIASLVTQIDVPAGKVLATQGQAGSEFFVIVTGKAEATRGSIPIGVLGPGTFFGEMSLLEHRPRVATVTTTEPATVLVLPSVDRKMLTVIADRLRDLEDRYVPVDARVISKDIA
jgi:CRP-like cAMP-binding protein